MKLHHIRDVSAVAETGSLRAAGRLLGITQPAISRSIRDIENDLGAPLFERHVNGVRLTPIGHAFLKRAEVIQSEMRRARDEVDQLKGNFVGQASMAMSPGAAIALTSRILRSFRRKYPKALLRMRQDFFQPVERSIKSGEIDFYLGAYDHELSSTSLSVERIADNQRVIIARAGHPLGNARSIRELRSAQWIRPSLANRPDETAFEEIFERAGLPRPEIVLHTTSTVMTMLAIADSDLLSFLPMQWLESPLIKSFVQPIPVADVALACPPLCIVRRSDLPLTPVAQHLYDLARNAAMNYSMDRKVPMAPMAVPVPDPILAE